MVLQPVCGSARKVQSIIDRSGVYGRQAEVSNSIG